MSIPVHFNPVHYEGEMTEGYLDGRTDDREELPPSLSNRSASYRHGWLNGRDDRLGTPRAPAWRLRLDASAAIAEDISGAAV